MTKTYDIIPEVVGSVVHYRLIVVVEVPGGLIVSLGVEVLLLAPPDVLLDYLDVLVPISPGVLVVEPEGVHDLMQSPSSAADIERQCIYYDDTQSHLHDCCGLWLIAFKDIFDGTLRLPAEAVAVLG